MSENFAGTVVVERVLSQLEAGCIFTGRVRTAASCA